MKNQEAVVAEVQNGIADTITLGRSWGMSDDEITKCLLQYSTIDQGDTKVDKPKQQQKSSNRNGSGAESETDGVSIFAWVWFIAKIMVMVPLCIILVLWGVYFFISIATVVSPQFEMFVGKVASPYVYPAMRHARKFLKPLTEYLGMSLAGKLKYNHRLDNNDSLLLSLYSLYNPPPLLCHYVQAHRPTWVCG